MRIAVVFAVIAVATAIIVAEALAAPSFVAGQRCAQAHEQQYQRAGYACVSVRGGGHRLARIVAEPAFRPKIKRSS